MSTEILDTDNLDTVLLSLQEIPGLLTGKKTNNDNIAKAISTLKSAVASLSSIVVNDHKEREVLEARVRVSEDAVDAQKQKKLRERFIISSLSQGENGSLIDKDKTGIQLAKHVSDLCFQKYATRIKEGEIASCYYLKNGAINLSLWDHGPGSSFQNLVEKIKSNENNKAVNVYFNFMLTKRRSKLLFEVRQLKKQAKIEKFWSDENGNITIQVDDKGQKQKITNYFDKPSETLKTFYINELKTK